MHNNTFYLFLIFPKWLHRLLEMYFCLGVNKVLVLVLVLVLRCVRHVLPKAPPACIMAAAH